MARTLALAWVVQYGVTVEPDGDHDNKLLAAYAWRASYKRQVAPLSVLLGVSLYYVLSLLVSHHRAMSFESRFDHQLLEGVASVSLCRNRVRCFLRGWKPSVVSEISEKVSRFITEGLALH